jgi:lysophospholipase L1-like esterase
MKTLRMPHRLEWDILESRRCPSLAYPGPEQPVERFDALAVTEHAVDLATVASGQASNVVFLGDSITQWFQQGAGASVWSSKIALLGAADLGVAGDTTNNVLWRVENGELAGQPKVAVLMIGTNNLGNGESVEQTVAGIKADIAAIHAISPNTEILLNGLFPRGLPTDLVRAEVLEVNAELSDLASSLGVVYSDPGAKLEMADGTIGPNFLTDLVHPNASGYEIWADGVIDTIQEMLSTATTNSPVTDATAPLSLEPATVAIPTTPVPVGPVSITPAKTTALGSTTATVSDITNPAQSPTPTLLNAPASVSSTPPVVKTATVPNTNVVQPVGVGHSVLLRIAQAASTAQNTDPSDDHLP